MSIRIICNDVVEALAPYGDGVFDGCLCDPPYGLNFMGRNWDGVVPDVNVWSEVLRVLKPGAFLLAFGGTRTWHRLACAVEDAGFELRDTLMYLYGQGFPKGHDFAYDIHKRAEQEAKHDLRFMQGTYLSKTVYACKKCGQVLLTCLSEQGASQLWKTWSQSKTPGSKQSSVEGWSYLETSERKVQRCEVCTMSHGIFADGTERWIHSRASSCDGPTSEQAIGENRGSTSCESQSIRQQNREPDAVFLERKAQAFRGWNVALKPGFEPIILAQKPRDGTFANNALEWGCGGLWVDGCRIGIGDDRTSGGESGRSAIWNENKDHERLERPTGGRWPANLLLQHAPGCICVGESEIPGQRQGTQRGDADFRGGNRDDIERNEYPFGESETVTNWQCVDGCPVKLLAEQTADIHSAGSKKPPGGWADTEATWGTYGQGEYSGARYGDTGTAARFFYQAKASPSERHAGLDDFYWQRDKSSPIGFTRITRDEWEQLAPRQRAQGNIHPTVKPLGIIEYIAKLIMPPEHRKLLVPFSGSGSEIIGAIQAGWGHIVGIDIVPEYNDIARARIKHYR